ncbi:MAG: hypothetical protein GY925_26345 [Actinomycetia bacterium]|nr:hypothetical protein [Actinomycetes bacterium]
MANEAYVSAQGDLLATHVVALELEMLLHQRPFMRALASYQGDTRGTGSDTIKKRQVDHDDIAETVAEGAAISGNTAVTDGSYTLSPSRRSIKRIISDLLQGIDNTALLREIALAQYNFAAVMKAFDAAFATAMASLTGTAGNTGVLMKATDWFVAEQTLVSRRAAGSKAALLYPHQWNNLRNDLRGEVGPWQLREDVQAAVAQASGDNFVGALNGTGVWISNQVADANAGADHGGGMFLLPRMQGPDGRMRGDAAIAYAEGSPSPVKLGTNRVMAAGGVVYSDYDLDGDKADSVMWTNYFVAVGIADAAKGIKVITDHE